MFKCNMACGAKTLRSILGYNLGFHLGSLDRIINTAAGSIGHLFQKLYTAKYLNPQSHKFRTVGADNFRFREGIQETNRVHKFTIS